MNVLFATNWLRVGGVETNLVLLTRELHRRGHSIVVAAAGGPLVEGVVAGGGRHVAIPIDSRSPRALVAAALRLEGLVLHHRTDVIHSFSAASSLVLGMASLVAAARGRRWPPVVASIMGLQSSPHEWTLTTQLRNYLATLRARRILVISPEIGRLVRKLPVAPARLVDCAVVGVDLEMAAAVTREQVESLRSRLRLPQHARVVLTIGNLSPRKSHQLFLRAAALVAPRFPDARFLIAGEGELRPQLEAEIQRLGLHGRAQLLGERADIVALLNLAEVYVKPGVVEGFVGITVLEAQVVGRPVVAFDTQDVRLAVTHEENGLIVKSADTGQLAAAISRLLDDQALAHRLAMNARRSVGEKFSIGAVADGLEQQYRLALAEDGRGA